VRIKHLYGKERQLFCKQNECAINHVL